MGTRKNRGTGESKDNSATQAANDTAGRRKNSRPESETASVEKIRDLIFGSQMQDYEQRFAHLEDALRKQIETVQTEISRRLDAIENSFQKQIAAFDARLAAEVEARSEETQKNSQKTIERIQALSKTMERLDASQSQNSDDLRAQLSELTGRLTDEIRSKHQESMEALQHSARQLEDDKIGRSALAKLLLSMAAELDIEPDNLRNG